MTNEQIARVCYEANRAYCKTIGDNSFGPWEEAPQWQKDTCIKGVENARNPDVKPEDSHYAWLNEKVATGWKYGPVKDPEKKEHPCMTPWTALPVEQRLKDVLFLAVARSLM